MRVLRLLLLIALGALAACTKSADEPSPAAAEARAQALAQEAEAAAAARVDPAHEAQAQQGPKGLSGTLGAMEKAMKGKIVSQRAATRPVAPEQMQASLPESVAGLSAATRTGTREGEPGAEVSAAEAAYAKGEASVRIRVLDLAGLQGVAAVAQTGWTAAKVDRKTADGFERSGTLAGHPSFEMYDGAAKRAELKVLVERRFLVDVTGEGVAFEALKAAAGTVDYAALAALKGAGKLVNPKAR